MVGNSEKIFTFAVASPDGEMVDALVSGASAERRVGSSPIPGTRSSVELLFLFNRLSMVSFFDTHVIFCHRKTKVFLFPLSVFRLFLLSL